MAPRRTAASMRRPRSRSITSCRPGARAGRVFCRGRRCRLRETRNTNRHKAACHRQAQPCCSFASLVPQSGVKAGLPAAMLPMLARIVRCLPTHTRRSEDSQALQQFSTPIPLRFAVCTAAGITPSDRVLEPSPGTGLLAVFAELAGGTLVLNELAEAPAALLDQLFANVEVTRFDAAQIDDHLDAAIVPSVVLMNPPFSALANVDRRMADVAFRHSPRQTRGSFRPRPAWRPMSLPCSAG